MRVRTITHNDLETSYGKKQAAKELVGCFEDVPSLAGFPENRGLASYAISTPFVVNVIGMITRKSPARNIALISVTSLDEPTVSRSSEKCPSWDFVRELHSAFSVEPSNE
jgi:hypothetical protein